MVNRISIGFFLTLSILIVEVVGGVLSQSLALLGDAGHVLSDVVALGLSLYGLKQAERLPNTHMTYGYHRVGILVAFINAAMLVGIALLVVAEAVRRLDEPRPVFGEMVLVVGVAGLAVNLFVMQLLRNHTSNLTVSSAFWHVMGDALGSVAVIVSGAIIWLTGWNWVDSIASLAVAVVIIIGSLRIIRRSVDVMLEASPRNVTTTALVQRIFSIPGVRDLHHLHIWALTPQLRALSCHVTIENVLVSDGNAIVSHMNEVLETEFSIGHSTIQLESEECDPNERYCTMGPEPERALVAHEH